MRISKKKNTKFRKRLTRKNKLKKGGAVSHKDILKILTDKLNSNESNKKKRENQLNRFKIYYTFLNIQEEFGKFKNLFENIQDLFEEFGKFKDLYENIQEEFSNIEAFGTFKDLYEKIRKEDDTNVVRLFSFGSNQSPSNMEKLVKLIQSLSN